MRFRALPLLVCLLSLPTFSQTQTTLEVAPGVTLPAGGDSTVFALDQKPAGPALVHIGPTEAKIASHAGSNFLRSAVYAGPHLSSDLAGAHANTSLSSSKVTLFVHLYGEDAELAIKRVHLVWADADKKNRHLADFSMNIFGGSRQRHMFDVPSTMERIEGTTWLKITPNEPLAPGEYAVVIIPSDPNQFPSAAYDFAVPGAVERHVNPYAAAPNRNQ